MLRSCCNKATRERLLLMGELIAAWEIRRVGTCAVPQPTQVSEVKGKVAKVAPAVFGVAILGKRRKEDQQVSAKR